MTDGRLVDPLADRGFYTVADAHAVVQAPVGELRREPAVDGAGPGGCQDSPQAPSQRR